MQDYQKYSAKQELCHFPRSAQLSAKPERLVSLDLHKRNFELPHDLGHTMEFNYYDICSNEATSNKLTSINDTCFDEERHESYFMDKKNQNEVQQDNEPSLFVMNGKILGAQDNNSRKYVKKREKRMDTLIQKPNQGLRAQPSHSRKNWSNKEDEKLKEFVVKYKFSWPAISHAMKKEGYMRSSRQNRDRYYNKLDPKITSDNWTKEEDDFMAELYSIYGSRWRRIAAFLPGRTELMIRNRFYKKFSQSLTRGSLIASQSASEKLNQPEVRRIEMKDLNSKDAPTLSFYDDVNKEKELNKEDDPQKNLFMKESPFESANHRADRNDSCLLERSNSISTVVPANPHPLEPKQLHTGDTTREEIANVITERIHMLTKILNKNMLSDDREGFAQKVLAEYKRIQELISCFKSTEEILDLMNMLESCLFKIRSWIFEAIQELDNFLKS